MNIEQIQITIGIYRAFNSSQTLLKLSISDTLIVALVVILGLMVIFIVSEVVIFVF